MAKDNKGTCVEIYYGKVKDLFISGSVVMTGEWHWEPEQGRIKVQGLTKLKSMFKINQNSLETLIKNEK